MTKTQAGLRLSIETWQQIRIAAMQNGVSASNLMDSLAAKFLRSGSSDIWSDEVIAEAKLRQKRWPKTENVSEPQNIVLNAEIAPETSKNGRKRRLTPENIMEIRAARSDGRKQAEIAADFGISQAYVSRLTRSEK